MFYFLTTLTSIGVLTYFYKEIICFVFTVIETPPGVSLIKKVGKKDYLVSTNLGQIKINWQKMPSIDHDLYYFNTGHTLEIKENKMMSKKEFNELFTGIETTMLKKYNNGIIADIYYPRDFKNQNQIVGFITNYFDDVIFVFVVNDNNVIDYKKIVDEYNEKIVDEYNEKIVDEYTRDECCCDTGKEEDQDREM